MIFTSAARVVLAEFGLFFSRNVASGGLLFFSAELARYGIEVDVFCTPVMNTSTRIRATLYQHHGNDLVQCPDYTDTSLIHCNIIHRHIHTIL